jgi:tetratricopeptide (TPR) repeat protein
MLNYYALRDQGNLEKAKLLLNDLLAEDSTYVMAWIEKGLNEIDLSQDSTQALIYFTKAIESDPCSFIGYEKRGNLYLLTDNYENALNDLTESIQIKGKKFIVTEEPQFMESSIKDLLFLRGLTYYNLDSLPQAYKDFSIAIKLDSIPIMSHEYPFTRQGNCYYWRGCILMEWGEIEKGCADLKKALSIGYINAQEEVDKYCNCETIKR